jgi:hypothetical protein
MNPRTHRHLTAWLGLVAMWLIVLVPIVSQLVVAVGKYEPTAILCSVHASSADTHHTDAPDLRACGYCDLLADHMRLPAFRPRYRFSSCS